jgi:hypothetical protein
MKIQLSKHPLHLTATREAACDATGLGEGSYGHGNEPSSQVISDEKVAALVLARRVFLTARCEERCSDGQNGSKR